MPWLGVALSCVVLGSTTESSRPSLWAQRPFRLTSQVLNSQNSSFHMQESQIQLLLHFCRKHGAEIRRTVLCSPPRVPVETNGKRSPSPGHATLRQRGTLSASFISFSHHSSLSASQQPKHNILGWLKHTVVLAASAAVSIQFNANIYSGYQQ